MQQDYALLDNLSVKALLKLEISSLSHAILIISYIRIKRAYSIIILPGNFFLFFFLFFFFYRYLVRASSAIPYTHTCIRISIHIWIYVCACICIPMHGYLRGGRIYVYEFMWWFVHTREIGTYAPLCECIWIRRKGITCYTVTYVYVNVLHCIRAPRTYLEIFPVCF